MKKPNLRQKWTRAAVFATAVATLALSAVILVVAVPRATRRTAVNAEARQVRQDLTAAQTIASALAARQVAMRRTIVAAAELQNEVTEAQLDLSGGRLAAARADLTRLRGRITDWNAQLDKPPPTPTPAPLAPDAIAAGGLNIPIVFYHHPPADFDQQLTRLEQRGYTVVTLDQVAAALGGAHAALPPKPAVITFDDGFSDQIAAASILARHRMPATFYIINGGPDTGWCIGAGRNDHPHGNCGDAYLNWDEIRALDRTGLVAIGSHTADHPCNQNGYIYTLNSMSPDQRRAEIAGSKSGIEQQLGHAIYHFAYPCGIYDQTVIDDVRAAGFTTATTVVAGSWQPFGGQYVLRRIRDTLSLQ
jgi:peptidoglycan/xylan/chitin deacetylase (PgdA/CDA1 family)